MTALGPIGALAVCDVQTVRVFSFDMNGSLGFASGTVDSIRVRFSPALAAALSFAGDVRNTPLVIRRSLGSVLRFGGLIVRVLQRAPLRFARRKGIITKGIDR